MPSLFNLIVFHIRLYSFASILINICVYVCITMLTLQTMILRHLHVHNLGICLEQSMYYKDGVLPFSQKGPIHPAAHPTSQVPFAWLHEALLIQ